MPSNRNPKHSDLGPIMVIGLHRLFIHQTHFLGTKLNFLLCVCWYIILPKMCVAFSSSINSAKKSWKITHILSDYGTNDYFSVYIAPYTRRAHFLNLLTARGVFLSIFMSRWGLMCTGNISTMCANSYRNVHLFLHKRIVVLM